MGASKASLSQALRSGESLAASCPPRMTVELSLAQSSLRSVVKRIKEIGATALVMNTHRTLTLRPVSTVSFSSADDKTDPLVTAMLLLTDNLLMAADFNNSCLKLFRKEENGEGWELAQVLALKWRPFSISKLSEERVSLLKTKDPRDHKPEELQDPSTMQFSPDERSKAAEASSGQTDEGVFVKKQAGDGKAATGVEVHLAVTSPFAGCFDVVVPVSSQRRMRVVRAIDEEKGYWGLDVVTKHKLAVSTIASGRSSITLLDTAQKSTQLVPLSSDISVTPLGTPRHVLVTSPSSIFIGDHGKKAVIHASLDGKILFTFKGNGSQKVSCPEGMCLDSQGHVYLADSGDHSIIVLTKGGHQYSRTGSQQSDLFCPQAVCMDKNSHLYVANERGKLLTVYDVFQEC